MAKENLDTLEYPRLMHCEDGTKRKVANVEEAEQALKDGYTLHPKLTKEQEKAVEKVLTPEQVKADAAVKKAADDAKAAELAAADAQAHADAVAAHKVESKKK